MVFTGNNHKFFPQKWNNKQQLVPQTKFHTNRKSTLKILNYTFFFISRPNQWRLPDKSGTRAIIIIAIIRKHGLMVRVVYRLAGRVEIQKYPIVMWRWRNTWEWGWTIKRPVSRVNDALTAEKRRHLWNRTRMFVLRECISKADDDGVTFDWKQWCRPNLILNSSKKCIADICFNKYKILMIASLL